MKEQTTEQVAKAMARDPTAWADVYLDLKQTSELQEKTIKELLAKLYPKKHPKLSDEFDYHNLTLP